MKRILEILPFYSLDEALCYLEKGGDKLPLHHVWCYDQIRNSGYRVSFIEGTNKGILSRIGRLVNIDNIAQQIKVIKGAKDYDLLFDPFMQFSFLIALLRVLGLYRKPIVAIAHRAHMVNKQNLFKRAKQWLIRYIFFKGMDHILFINKKVFSESQKYKIKGKTDYLTTWGVEYDFFDSYAKQQSIPPTGDYIYATGGSARDYTTLIKSFEDLDFHLKITSRYDISNEIKCPVTPNVTIDNSIMPGLTSTGMLRKEYYNALAVALPIGHHFSFAPWGYTVLFEAMAAGKPIIATNNLAFDINIEKEKIGLLVEYGDVHGWKEAIQYLIDNPEEAKEMGSRGLALCKLKYNYKSFSQEVIKTIDKTLGKSRSTIVCQSKQLRSIQHEEKLPL